MYINLYVYLEKEKIVRKKYWEDYKEIGIDIFIILIRFSGIFQWNIIFNLVFYFIYLCIFFYILIIKNEEINFFKDSEVLFYCFIYLQSLGLEEINRCINERVLGGLILRD